MEFSQEHKNAANDVSNAIIGAAIEVHRHLGPGLLESAYERCLCRELEVRGIEFERQKWLPIEYKGMRIDDAFRLDILVCRSVIVEVKAIDGFAPIHDAQLLTYLRLSNQWLGLLVNFKVPLLKNGIKRIVLG